MKKEVKGLIQSIIYIMMGLQIVLGLVWAVANIGQVPAFEESVELLQMSENLCIDEYTGIVYPLCIRVGTLLEKAAGIPGCAFLYVLQLVLACLAYGYFLRKVLGLKAWGKVCFLTGFVLTVPAVLQWHMAVLPYSPATSVFVIFLADTTDLWKKEAILTVKKVVRLGVWWVICAQICPDYAWLCGILLCISTLGYIFLHKQDFLKLLALLVAGTLCIGGLNAALQTPASTDKIQKTAGSALMMRFVWPNFMSFYSFWSEDIKTLWELEEMAEFSTYPEQVIYSFGGAVEAAYGKERANEIYWEMAKIALNLDTKNVLRNMATDGAAYICPPLTMLVELEGYGVSYTGWNYGRMKDHTPLLAEYYTDYALSAWVYILVLCVVLRCLSVEHKRKEELQVSAKTQPKKRKWLGAYWGVTVLLIDLWYMLCTGGMQDYKKVMVNSILWGFFFIYLLTREEGQGRRTI